MNLRVPASRLAASLVDCAQAPPRTRSRFHIAARHATEQHLIAPNDAANASDGGTWTRIDWRHFSGSSGVRGS